MDHANQTLLVRLALAMSLLSLVIVAVVASQSSKQEPAIAAAASPVKVSLSEYAIAPSAITVAKGGTLSITNDGTMAHNFEVKQTSVKIADVAAGGSKQLDVSSLAPGTYDVFCSVAGHEDSGMKGTLVIGDGSAVSSKEATDMASMDHGAAPSAGPDLSTMSAGSPAAERMNKEMEASMTKGVKTFLDYAGRYAKGYVKAGNQPLKPKVTADGTKHFFLTASIIDWEVSPGKIVKAWAYNGQVPGPWIRVEPGDKVAVTLRNDLPISTDIHWHGIDVPNEMDGVAPITQDYIEPNSSYTYAFTAPDHTELGMYHAHMHGQVAIPNGLFAIVQVGDVPLPRGRTVSGVEVPRDLKVAQEIPMVLNDAGVIGLSLNGKAFPETQPIAAKKGDWILIHYYNEGLQGHPMHLHHQPQIVVAKDGFALDSPYRVDTVWIAPGERYSVLVKAEDVGTWAFHCHIVSHAENDDGLTGMVTAMVVK